MYPFVLPIPAWYGCSLQLSYISLLKIIIDILECFNIQFWFYPRKMPFLLFLIKIKTDYNLSFRIRAPMHFLSCKDCSLRGNCFTIDTFWDAVLMGSAMCTYFFILSLWVR